MPCHTMLTLMHSTNTPAKNRSFRSFAYVKVYTVHLVPMSHDNLKLPADSNDASAYQKLHQPI
jgi:hypothetical protein